MDDAASTGWIGMAWDEEAAPASAVTAKANVSFLSMSFPSIAYCLSRSAQ
jgi:hypothetical protein